MVDYVSRHGYTGPELASKLTTRPASSGVLSPRHSTFSESLFPSTPHTPTPSAFLLAFPTVRIYEVISGNCGSSKEYISWSYRRVRYRLVGYGSSALNIYQKERNT